MTSGQDSTLNCGQRSQIDSGNNSTLNSGTGHIIQRGSLAHLYIYPWNSDSCRCHIQQLAKNSTAKEGHNSTKKPLNINSGSVLTEGSFYLTPA